MAKKIISKNKVGFVDAEDWPRIEEDAWQKLVDDFGLYRDSSGGSYIPLDLACLTYYYSLWPHEETPVSSKHEEWAERIFENYRSVKLDSNYRSLVNSLIDLVADDPEQAAWVIASLVFTLNPKE